MVDKYIKIQKIFIIIFLIASIITIAISGYAFVTILDSTAGNYFSNVFASILVFYIVCFVLEFGFIFRHQSLLSRNQDFKRVKIINTGILMALTVMMFFGTFSIMLLAVMYEG